MSESNIQNRPVLAVAISPATHEDREKLQQALSDLAQQDSAIRITREPLNGQTIISGTGEAHLKEICRRILLEYKVQVDADEPKVIYVETIRKDAEGEGSFMRQIGGRGQYAHVKVRLEPGEPGSGYQFVDETSSGAVASGFAESVNFGIQEAMKGGVLAGYEMIDVKAIFYDCSYHDVDSNEMAFKIAGSMAFNEAARRASPVLLEPVMSVEILVPEEYIGSIMGDLNARRGRIESMDHHAGLPAIRANVPLAEMLGYETHLRLSAQGRAKYSMHFNCYEVAPRRGERGGDQIGVTANKPKGPKAGRGFASAKLDEE